MLQKWAIHFAIQFVVRQLAKFGHQLDWAKVKADFAQRAADVMPGKFFDEEVKGLTVAVLDACEQVLEASGAIEHILTLLAAEEYTKALDELKALLLAVWTPASEAAVKAHAVLFAA